MFVSSLALGTNKQPKYCPISRCSNLDEHPKIAIENSIQIPIDKLEKWIA
jgi:hypothetical protein